MFDHPLPLLNMCLVGSNLEIGETVNSDSQEHVEKRVVHDNHENYEVDGADTA